MRTPAMARTNSRQFIICDETTVVEARDGLEERSPKKRRRDDPVEEAQNGLATGPYERDPKYFMEDASADCIIRVEQFLFKIELDLIVCCPQLRDALLDHVKRYGLTTEEKPFLCSLPTVNEFRAFLWALRAPVEQLAETPSNDEELQRFNLIFKMNTKYDMPGLQNWVDLKLYSVASHNVLLESCSSSSLGLLLDMTVDKKYEQSRSLIVKKWYDRVLKKSTPSVPALQAAEKHNLDDLRGISYYVQVQDIMDRQAGTTESGATQLRVDTKLNTSQIMRLLSGYWSLVNLWEQLRLNPIALPMGNKCTEEEHRKCTATWDRRWVSAAGWKRILGLNSADALALMDCLRDQLSNDDDLKNALDPQCRLAGLDALKALRAKTKEGLVDHFSMPRSG